MLNSTSRLLCPNERNGWARTGENSCEGNVDWTGSMQRSFRPRSCAPGITPSPALVCGMPSSIGNARCSRDVSSIPLSSSRPANGASPPCEGSMVGWKNSEFYNCIPSDHHPTTSQRVLNNPLRTESHSFQPYAHWTGSFRVAINKTSAQSDE